MKKFRILLVFIFLLALALNAFSYINQEFDSCDVFEENGQFKTLLISEAGEYTFKEGLSCELDMGWSSYHNAIQINADGVRLYCNGLKLKISSKGTIERAGIGLLSGTKNIVIRGCNIEGGHYGIHGIEVGGSTGTAADNIYIQHNTFTKQKLDAVFLQQVTRTQIVSNYISQAERNAVNIDLKKMLQFHYNIIENNKSGAAIDSSSETGTQTIYIRNNMFLSNNSTALKIDDGSSDNGNIYVQNNLFKDNRSYGFHMTDGGAKNFIVSENLFQGTTVGGSHPSGLWVYIIGGQAPKLLYDNVFLDNSYGIGRARYFGPESKVYNNYFKNNIENIWGAGVSVGGIFNTEKDTEKINIIGRKAFGGNYWHDYEGSDEDNDYFGDEPHVTANGKITDNLPLVKPKADWAPFVWDFDVYPLAGAPPLEVTIEGYCADVENELVACIVDFGDGEKVYSLEGTKSRKHKYWAAGRYEVKMTAYDRKGKSKTETKTVIVSTTGTPEIVLVGNPTDGGSPLTVDFTGSYVEYFTPYHVWLYYDKGNPEEGYWDLELERAEGEVRTDLTDVTHEYAQGVYTAHLYLCTESEGCYEGKTLSINAGAHASLAKILSAEPDEGEIGLAVSFQLMCSDQDDDLASATLYFGDGSSQRVLQYGPGVPIANKCKPATHTYTSSGKFNATLIAEDSLGNTSSDSKVITIYPENNPPVADLKVRIATEPSGAERESVSGKLPADGTLEVVFVARCYDADGGMGECLPLGDGIIVDGNLIVDGIDIGDGYEIVNGIGGGITTSESQHISSPTDFISFANGADGSIPVNFCKVPAHKLESCVLTFSDRPDEIVIWGKKEVPITYAVEGEFYAKLTAIDKVGAKDEAYAYVTVVGVGGTLSIDATNTTVGENTTLTSICKNEYRQTISGTLDLEFTQTGSPVKVLEGTMECNTEKEFGPFTNEGVYSVKATLRDCTGQCTATAFFSVGKAISTFSIPEIHPLLVLAIALSVLFIIKRK